MFFVVLWIVFAILVGVYAGKKGRSGVGFFFLSLLLSPLVGFLIALVASPNREEAARQSGLKKCPACAEFVQAEAQICRFCQHSFIEEMRAKAAAFDEERAREAAAQAEHDAKEAAKPWIKRVSARPILFGAGIYAIMALVVWYSRSHSPSQAPQQAVQQFAQQAVQQFAQQVPSGATEASAVLSSCGLPDSDRTKQVPGAEMRTMRYGKTELVFFRDSQHPTWRFGNAFVVGHDSDIGAEGASKRMPCLKDGFRSLVDEKH